MKDYEFYYGDELEAEAQKEYDLEVEYDLWVVQQEMEEGVFDLQKEDRLLEEYLEDESYDTRKI